jgi:DNA-directed RNA polymerase specialized sigma24 family protein
LSAEFRLTEVGRQAAADIYPWALIVVNRLARWMDRDERESLAGKVACIAAANWRPARGALSTYTVSVARSQIHNQNATPKRRARLAPTRSMTGLVQGEDGPADFDPPDHRGVPPDDLAVDRETWAAIFAGLDGLPDRLRRIVGLHHGGVGFRDIGAELGVSGQRADQLYRQAIARLRSRVSASV